MNLNVSVHKYYIVLYCIILYYIILYYIILYYIILYYIILYYIILYYTYYDIGLTEKLVQNLKFGCTFYALLSIAVASNTTFIKVKRFIGLYKLSR